jgi:hypothetical protein
VSTIVVPGSIGPVEPVEVVVAVVVVGSPVVGGAVDSLPVAVPPGVVVGVFGAVVLPVPAGSR